VEENDNEKHSSNNPMAIKSFIGPGLLFEVDETSSQGILKGEVSMYC
jgi:hypothetical protein